MKADPLRFRYTLHGGIDPVREIPVQSLPEKRLLVPDIDHVTVLWSYVYSYAATPIAPEGNVQEQGSILDVVSMEWTEDCKMDQGLCCYSLRMFNPKQTVLSD